jgi:hypothetical protein
VKFDSFRYVGILKSPYCNDNGSTKMTVLRDVAPCSPVEIDR